MKEGTSRSRRIRIAAAVCAIVIAAGGSAGAYALRKNSNAKAAPAETSMINASAAVDNEIISVGGTVESSQLSDSFGLKDTALRLIVEKVMAEQGESVTAGTPLYQITSESLAKAEKTLNSELQSAKNDLLKQKITYQTDKNEAYLLYQSELLLGETAQAEYDSGMASLDSALNKAKEAYQEALDTITNSPAEIESKQAELDTMQSSVNSLTEKQKTAQDSADEAEKKYTSAAESYNSAASEYNGAASVARYLGKALGKDVSGLDDAGSVTADIQKEEAVPEDENVPVHDGSEPSFDMSEGTPDEMPENGFSFDKNAAGEGKNFMTDMPQNKEDKKAPEAAAQEKAPQSTKAAENKTETKAESKSDTKTEEVSSGSPELNALYETALSEYNDQKKKLSAAEEVLKTAETEYKTRSEELTAAKNELKEAQSKASSLSKEISTLNTDLSKAKSNISKLRSEYNSLNASYSSDQLELKNKLDTDKASYENAEYHYEITCSTIEKELEEKQTAYDTAEENLRIFSEELAEGYIYAKQDGTIYSLNCQEGRNANINMPYVYYVDESGYSTTVELDQNDVTQISIGDKAIIYSSETGVVNGKITAISEGTSTSLADVRFNVTVTADEGAELYVGQSVNVYFNSGDMQTGSFSDFAGGKSSDGDRPDFGGNMPGGFDPSNMPDFGGGSRGDFDPSSMPDFGRRKDN